MPTLTWPNTLSNIDEYALGLFFTIRCITPYTRETNFVKRKKMNIKSTGFKYSCIYCVSLEWHGLNSCNYVWCIWSVVLRQKYEFVFQNGPVDCRLFAIFEEHQCSLFDVWEGEGLSQDAFPVISLIPSEYQTYRNQHVPSNTSDKKIRIRLYEWNGKYIKHQNIDLNAVCHVGPTMRVQHFKINIHNYVILIFTIVILITCTYISH